MKTYVSPRDTPRDLKEKCNEKLKNCDDFEVETCFYKLDKIKKNEVIVKKFDDDNQNIHTLLLVLKNKKNAIMRDDKLKKMFH
eukprot:CAMPEP_0197047880 /NCGR_PEP_ID=MMETSP1384-20130603/23323_1 /TAXON_ID=29189 /ORGANISM="Ammonia sp." /LENGTH=82 /DNA_ID=CAMNT_0042479907 /DNA_START=1 /DNA_END=246 /DNA_ORIENTATION=-